MWRQVLKLLLRLPAGVPVTGAIDEAVRPRPPPTLGEEKKQPRPSDRTDLAGVWDSGKMKMLSSARLQGR